MGRFGGECGGCGSVGRCVDLWGVWEAMVLNILIVAW